MKKILLSILIALALCVTSVATPFAAIGDDVKTSTSASKDAQKNAGKTPTNNTKPTLKALGQAQEKQAEADAEAQAAKTTTPQSTHTSQKTQQAKKALDDYDAQTKAENAKREQETRAEVNKTEKIWGSGDTIDDAYENAQKRTEALQKQLDKAAQDVVDKLGTAQEQAAKDKLKEVSDALKAAEEAQKRIKETMDANKERVEGRQALQDAYDQLTRQDAIYARMSASGAERGELTKSLIETLTKYDKAISDGGYQEMKTLYKAGSVGPDRRKFETDTYVTTGIIQWGETGYVNMGKQSGDVAAYFKEKQGNKVINIGKQSGEVDKYFKEGQSGEVDKYFTQGQSGEIKITGQSGEVDKYFTQGQSGEVNKYFTQGQSGEVDEYFRKGQSGEIKITGQSGYTPTTPDGVFIGNSGYVYSTSMWWTLDYGMARQYVLRPWEFGYLSYHSALRDTMGEYSDAEMWYNTIYNGVALAVDIAGALPSIANGISDVVSAIDAYRTASATEDLAQAQADKENAAKDISAAEAALTDAKQRAEVAQSEAIAADAVISEQEELAKNYAEAEKEAMEDYNLDAAREARQLKEEALGKAEEANQLKEQKIKEAAQADGEAAAAQQALENANKRLQEADEAETEARQDLRDLSDIDDATEDRQALEEEYSRVDAAEKTATANAQRSEQAEKDALKAANDAREEQRKAEVELSKLERGKKIAQDVGDEQSVRDYEYQISEKNKEIANYDQAAVNAQNEAKVHAQQAKNYREEATELGEEAAETRADLEDARSLERAAQEKYNKTIQDAEALAYLKTHPNSAGEGSGGNPPSESAQQEEQAG